MAEKETEFKCYCGEDMTVAVMRQCSKVSRTAIKVAKEGVKLPSTPSHFQLQCSKGHWAEYIVNCPVGLTNVDAEYI